MENLLKFQLERMVVTNAQRSLRPKSCTGLTVILALQQLFFRNIFGGGLNF